MKGLGCRGFVEIEIAAEHFISPFTTQHHFDSHAFNDACQQIHRGRGANGGDIVSFDVVNDVADSVQSFLDGIVDFMMHGSDKAGHFAGFYQVGRTFQTDSKGMELRPPGIFFIVGFYPFACIFLGNGRDDGTVQTAGKKYAVGHITHQLAFNGLFQSVVYVQGIGIVVFHGFVFKPVADVPAGHLAFFSPIVMAGKEGFVFITEPFEGFQLAGAVYFAVLILTYI